MAALIAFVLICVAIPLQQLGYTGTCTQGAKGPFLTGVTLSGPLLLICLALLLVSARRTWRAPKQGGHPLRCIAAIAVIAVALWSIHLNHALAINTLATGIGPCGPDHAAIDGRRFEWRNLMVGFAYAVMPVLIAFAAARLAWTARPSGH